jgi:two-component system, LuxR family, sensor kinase FixL
MERANRRGDHSGVVVSTTLAAQLPDEVKPAQRMTQWLETVQGQLRNIIRQLVPVEIDKHGLVTALRGLAERTSEVHDAVCTFACQQSISVADTALSTHVYRIAHEAVQNAVKHAKASQIRIQLTENDGMLRLKVDDDGIGIDAAAERSTGFGLCSMAYRAGLIGATLTCRQKEVGGTQVTCTLLRGRSAVNGECLNEND